MCVPAHTGADRVLEVATRLRGPFSWHSLCQTPWRNRPYPTGWLAIRREISGYAARLEMGNMGDRVSGMENGNELSHTYGREMPNRRTHCWVTIRLTGKLQGTCAKVKRA